MRMVRVWSCRVWQPEWLYSIPLKTTWVARIFRSYQLIKSLNFYFTRYKIIIYLVLICSYYINMLCFLLFVCPTFSKSLCRTYSLYLMEKTENLYWNMTVHLSVGICTSYASGYWKRVCSAVLLDKVEGWGSSR